LQLITCPTCVQFSRHVTYLLVYLWRVLNKCHGFTNRTKIYNKILCAFKTNTGKNSWSLLYTRAVCKVRGLTLLLRVGIMEVRWRSLFEVPPLASEALLTTLHPLVENVLQTVDHFEISCLGAPFRGWKSPEIAWGRDLNWILCPAWKTRIGGTPLKHTPYNSDLAPWDFWAFPTMKRKLRGKKFRSDQRSAAHFRQVGRAL
jgi:hypothetical protein